MDLNASLGGLFTSQLSDDITEITGIFNAEMQKENENLLKWTVLEYIELIAIALTQF